MRKRNSTEISVDFSFHLDPVRVVHLNLVVSIWNPTATKANELGNRTKKCANLQGLVPEVH